MLLFGALVVGAFYSKGTGSGLDTPTALIVAVAYVGIIVIVAWVLTRNERKRQDRR